MSKSKKVTKPLRIKPLKLTLENHFEVVIADPPWSFNDKLTMSEVKRGAASQYPTLTIGAIAGLDVARLMAPNALLALWVPSALLVEGLRVLDAWGFKHKGIYTWVKIGKAETQVDPETAVNGGPSLAFGMGRYFRGCSEHALIGTRGSFMPLSKSERNVELFKALPHSQKPDGLHERLERMYPKATKLELFARRCRAGWTCVGDECPDTKGVDIRDWLYNALPKTKVA